MSNNKAKCHVKAEWLLKKDNLGHVISMWGKKLSETIVYCNVCNRSIKCANKGFQAISQHYSNKIHIDNISTKLSANQMHLTGSCSQPTDALALNSNANVYNMRMEFCMLDQTVIAELLWAMKVIVSNMSAASCDNIGQVFNKMFPMGFPPKFSLGRTKLGYIITEALGPYFRQIVLNDASNALFTLIFDETTNNESEKELQTAIRYYSDSEQQVVLHHLETFFISHAKAEDLLLHITKALDNGNLQLSQMLMLGCDGPNVNKKVLRLLTENVKADRKDKLLGNKGLIDIGSCNIHTVHNGFCKGLGEIGEDVSDLIIQLFYFFDGWPARWEDFNVIQKECHLKTHRFIKHVQSRWLTITAAAQRVLEQWPAIVKYFLTFVPKHKTHIAGSNKYSSIRNLIKRSDMKAQVSFVIHSAKCFTKFTEFFQREEPLIHVLHDELQNLLLILASKVCKPSFIINLTGITDDIFKKENLTDCAKTDVGVETTTILNSLAEKDRLHFLHRAQRHYITSARHLIQKTSISIPLLKSFKCLQADEIKKIKSSSSILKIAQELPLPLLSLTDLSNEWKLLQLENLPSKLKGQRIDHFWAKIFALENDFGYIKYPLICKVVKGVLALSHGSADIERGFSRSKLVLTDDKSSMKVRTLNARLNVKDGLRKYDNRPDLVPITKDLICMSKQAHKKYESYLEAEREKAKLKAVLEKEAALKKEEELNNLHRLTETKKKIDELQEEFKIAKQETDGKKKSADTLLEEANARLKMAVTKNDMTGIQIAQGLIDGAMSLRQQERSSEISLATITNQLEKRKSSLISNFFAKKPKPN